MVESTLRGRKRNLILVIAKAALASLKCAVTAAFQKQEGAPKYARNVLNSALRVVTSQTSVETAQYIQPSTETTYNFFSRVRQCKTDIVALGGGAKGLWIGRRDAEYVMLYFHGGGFVISATHGHILYQFKLQKKLSKLGHSFALFSLAYTLAPGTKYPGEATNIAIRCYARAQGNGDHYIQPMKAPLECWAKVVSSVVREMMLWTGSGEILFDEISSFATLVRQAIAATKSSPTSSDTKEQQPHHKESRINFVITEKASHEMMLLDTLFFRNSKPNGSGDITDWFTKILTSQSASD